MAQPIEGLLFSQEDLCVIPSTYMVKAMHGGTHVQSQHWESRKQQVPVACCSQLHSSIELSANEKHCLKTKKPR